MDTYVHIYILICDHVSHKQNHRIVVEFDEGVPPKQELTRKEPVQVRVDKTGPNGEMELDRAGKCKAALARAGFNCIRGIRNRAKLVTGTLGIPVINGGMWVMVLLYCNGHLSVSFYGLVALW